MKAHTFPFLAGLLCRSAPSPGRLFFSVAELEARVGDFAACEGAFVPATLPILLLREDVADLPACEGAFFGDEPVATMTIARSKSRSKRAE